ncbi:MAG: 3-hydroxyacyl-CoA dehydrogenase [Candidatus Lokiarchaeia archaeon]
MKIDDIKTITVLGAGHMGLGIAQVIAMSGYQVNLRDLNKEIINKTLDRIRYILTRFAEKGKISSDIIEPTMERIRPFTDLKESVKDAQYVIETVPEQLELKQKVFREVEKRVPEDVIISTNTSALPITEIQRGTERPGKIVGTHFFNPPQRIKLVEVVYGAETSDETVNLTLELMKRIDRDPVVCKKDVPGFLANRTVTMMLNFVSWLVSAGEFTPAEIDCAFHYKLGQPMGTFGLSDFLGLKTTYSVQKFISQREPEFKVPPVWEDLVKAGHNGVDTGKGFYEYPDKVWKQPESWSEEIADRYDPNWSLLVGINRMAQIINDGVATVEEVDKAVKVGYLMPVGLLELADQMGIDKVVEGLEELKKRFGKIDNLNYMLEPNPLLREKVKKGELGNKTKMGFYKH